MLSINGKKFMNLPEAVQWLLDNNALPFQCKANYVADTIIAKTDIINPSPAEIKVGSLVLFADSKVGTVSGVTDSGFMVGQDYTDIGSQLNQIADIDLDASEHLVFTMANGDTIDAGLLKEISSFSIDASQHLIANYNDGTTQDIGAIFQGNINIAGNLTADSIIENMSGYTFAPPAASEDYEVENVYAGVVKNGNKITFVWAGNVTRKTANALNIYLTFNIPLAVGDKLYPTTIRGYNALSFKTNLNAEPVEAGTSKVYSEFWFKVTSASVRINIFSSDFTTDVKYYVRSEITFLLSDSLAS